jgi:hypothetical protein
MKRRDFLAAALAAGPADAVAAGDDPERPQDDAQPKRPDRADQTGRGVPERL